MNGEFKYEKEIRLDEERIARYFDNIVVFMDLPGENEAVFERIAKIGNEKVCKCESPGLLRKMTPSWGSDAGDEDESENVRSSSGFDNIDDWEIQDMLDGVSVYFAELTALNEDAEIEAQYTAILCQCGKTLGRVADMVCTNGSECGMKIALGKRALKDLNDLIGMVVQLGRKNHKLKVNNVHDVLQLIRKKVLDILFEVEKN